MRIQDVTIGMHDKPIDPAATHGSALSPTHNSIGMQSTRGFGTPFR